MKRLIFLMAPVLALLLSGCLHSGGFFLEKSYDPPGLSALTNSRTPQTLQGSDNRGIHLSLSPRSSVSIDVECILDYVQGEAVYRPEYETDDQLNPWIRFIYTY